MVAAIRLTVLTGPHKHRKFCFAGPTRCLAGRSVDCFVRLSGTERDQLISRRHCRLDINPPEVRVEDLGSSNGTYVNGKKVEAHANALTEPGECGAVVNHGDLLTLGGTTLLVDYLECPHAECEGKPVWSADETTKDDCLLAC